MIIVDNNGIAYLREQQASTGVVRPAFITPDVQDEYEVAHSEPLPSDIKNVFDTSWFDKARYLHYYREMLNKHAGRSFYNMTGFGDISILALLKTLEAERAASLFSNDPIELITGDGGLIKRVTREFAGKPGTFGGYINITRVRPSTS